jgi:CRISPR-associated protein Cas1
MADGKQARGMNGTDVVLDTDPLPVRMLNEYAYCPRLFHLMHVEGCWGDNAFTVEGRAVHRRVDKLDHVLPDAAPENNAAAPADPAAPGGDEPPEVSRSVSLGSERLGITGKLDLVSTAGDEAAPVERKRGKVPNNPERSWEPERVQLMAQGMLLREQGYRCDHGILYFAGSRTRVTVPFAPELEARTLVLIDEARRAAQATDLPDPLVDSPKCNGCSLAPICLPDETLALRDTPPDPAAPSARRLYPVRDDAVPLYVATQGAIVGRADSCLVVRKEGEELARARLRDTSQVVLLGNVQVSAQALHTLCESDVPVLHFSTGHWFYGLTHGLGPRNSFNRVAQFEAARDPTRRLALAREIVRAKGGNQRTLLRRNASPRPDAELDQMADLIERVARAESPDSLLGYEGSLAACYFRGFSKMLKADEFAGDWAFTHRNRRPPRDPLNAMLSFGYALLVKECTTALVGEGLDPWWGVYHQPRHGRPGLALDLMEEFRPLVVDSAVLTAANTGMVSRRQFACSRSGCLMKDPARKALIQAYEARLDQLVTHPLFDYRASMRAMLRVQARLLARWFRGDIPAYTGFTTR